MNLFCKKSKWIDIAVSECLGYYILIQMRYNLKTNKKQFRKVKLWVNDISVKNQMNENIMKYYV